MTSCPCGSGTAYAECCGLYISHQKLPPTPEALMRSRYTAFTQANMAYISETMLSPAADHFNPAETKAWATKVIWLGLNVLKTRQQATQGIVEFIASYRLGQEPQALHEISEFRFENGRWFYTDGTHPQKTTP